MKSREDYCLFLNYVILPFNEDQRSDFHVFNITVVWLVCVKLFQFSCCKNEHFGNFSFENAIVIWKTPQKATKIHLTSTENIVLFIFSSKGCPFIHTDIGICHYLLKTRKCTIIHRILYSQNQSLENQFS